jgi:2'-5' RNA ligase
MEATVAPVAKERLKSPRARLFVALDLPDAVRDGIVAWQRYELTDPALRVVRAQSLHLTLAFLGYHPEREIEAIAEAALAAGGVAPEVRFAAEPKAIPSRKRARLFALGGEADDVVTMQADVSDRLEGEGFYKPEKRPFWPHLTVARVKQERRGSRRPVVVETDPGPLPDELCEPFRCVRLALYRSYLRPQGAEYVPLAQLELPSEAAAR